MITRVGFVIALSSSTAFAIDLPDWAFRPGEPRCNLLPTIRVLNQLAQQPGGLAAAAERARDWVWPVGSFFQPRTRRVFLNAVQRANLGEEVDPVMALRAEFNRPDLHLRASGERRSQRPLDSTWDLETDVVNLFGAAPELRDLRAFREKWQLTEEEAQDLLTFYGLRFFGNLDVAGGARVALGRLRGLALEQYRANPNIPAARNYEYYRLNLTRRSVHEMARDLGISEREIYHQLGFLNLSIIEAFESLTPAERAQRAIHSPEAYDFYSHAVRETMRGIDWNRAVLDRGRAWSEAQLLIDLYRRGYNYAEIADRLNQAAQAAQLARDGVPALLEPRTENSVGAKLRELDLVITPAARVANPQELTLPIYGQVKRGGTLVPETAIFYLIDHYDWSLDRLAADLGVEQGSLANFIQRHHLQGVAGIRLDHLRASPSGVTAESSGARLALYERQVDLVDRVLRFVAANQGVPPRTTEFSGRNGLGDYSNLRGVFSPYPNSTLGNRLPQLFPSAADFWLAVARRARERAIPLRVEAIRFQGPVPAELRDLMQESVLNQVSTRLIAEREAGGDWNLGANAVERVSQYVDVSAHGLMGTGNYRPGGSLRESRIFDSPAEFWLRLHERMNGPGRPHFSIVGIDVREFSRGDAPEYYRRWMQTIGQQDATRAYLDLLERHPDHEPSLKDWESMLGLGRGALVDPRGMLFPTSADAVLALTRLARQAVGFHTGRLPRVRTLDFDIRRSHRTPEFIDRQREEIREEMTEVVLQQSIRDLRRLRSDLVYRRSDRVFSAQGAYSNFNVALRDWVISIESDPRFTPEQRAEFRRQIERPELAR